MRYFKYFFSGIITFAVIVALCGCNIGIEYSYKEVHYQDFGIISHKSVNLIRHNMFNYELKFESTVTYKGINHTYYDEPFYNFYNLGDSVAIDCCDYYRAEVDSDTGNIEDYELYKRDFSLTSAS